MATYILGIESSCDETAASVVQDGRRVLSNVVASSVDEQALYGGVVPEIASRRHAESISAVTHKALADAGVSLAEITAVAPTFAPGLIGALLVGINFAKGLAYAAEKPLVPVHHLRGHVASLLISHADLAPPFLCLVVSGGHSHLVQVHTPTAIEVIGHTVDDAAGEAFDKVARTLGLGYPGGPAVSKAAQQGDATLYNLPTPSAPGEYNMSFSGLKTAVMNLVNTATMKGEPLDVPSLAASFEQTVCTVLTDRLFAAAEHVKADTVCICGGVSANRVLRAQTQRLAKERGLRAAFPDLAYCGDNAAMIAAQGFYELQVGNTAGYDLNGYPTWPMEEDYSAP